MRLLSFRVQFLQLWLICRCWVQFCTKKLENARRKLLKLGNKHRTLVPIAASFILERNLIGLDFDHVLGNHFCAMSARHAMSKSTLWIVIFVKLHLNTWFPLSLKLTFSSQNHYQKFSRRTACLGPCPAGKEGEKVTCPKGKSTCPGRPDGGFFEPRVLPKDQTWFLMELQNDLVSRHEDFVSRSCLL